MSWWDHDELKNPKDRSDRYIINFPDEYTQREVAAAQNRIDLEKCHLNRDSTREIPAAKPKKETLMGNSLFSNLLKNAGNEFAAVASDGIAAGDVTGYYDTGSYTFNAALSGSIFGGLPNNGVTAFAGEPSTGKTFFALSIAKRFLDDNPEGFVFYFETESAMTKDSLEARDVDTERFGVVPVGTVEDFRTQAIKIIDGYAETKGQVPPMLFILDSLGGLSTAKEVTDMSEGKGTRDMTRAQLIRGAFRVLTLKLGLVKVPLIVTNHIYDVVGAYIPTKKMGGGCLVAGTKIRTPDGLENIETIKIGDWVDTLFGPQIVTNTFSFDDKDVYELECDDGIVIRCSADHKFLVDGRWVTVVEMLAQVKNTEMINIEVAHMDGNLDVYRQQVQENLFLDTRASEAA